MHSVYIKKKKKRNTEAVSAHVADPAASNLANFLGMAHILQNNFGNKGLTVNNTKITMQ